MELDLGFSDLFLFRSDLIFDFLELDLEFLSLYI